MSKSNLQSEINSKRLKVPLKLQVDTTSLSILKASYDRHFGEYCKDRKQVTQVLPAKVWKHVFADFLKSCDELIQSEDDPDIKCVEDLGLKAERTYQLNLKEVLKSMDTGVSNSRGSDNAVLQQNEVLKELRKTDDHARRHMIAKRSVLLSQPDSPVVVGADGIQKGSKPRSLAGVEQTNSESTSKCRTKAEIMQQGVNALDIMADSFTSTCNRMNEIFADELKESRRRSKVIEDGFELKAKRLKMDERMAEKRLQMDVEKSKMEKIKFLFDNGVLSLEEFQTRSLALLE